MRVFVAGSTGVVGSRLIPLLIGAGHDVIAMTRAPEKRERLLALGAEPSLVDALDRDAVIRAVVGARPDVVVHQLTALSKAVNLRKFDRDFTQTNRLRTEGTDHLLEAARVSGARRFLAQSFAGWPYAHEGGPVKTEQDPLDPRPLESMSRSLAAIRHLESAVSGVQTMVGIVLRYGTFYGPDTALGTGGPILKMVKKRMLPVVGGGTGVWSFIHVEDAAEATLLALERGASGIYNIVDDEPAPVSTWLPELAASIGAKRPLSIPIWLARLAIGEPGILLMTRARGASNDKAKRELGFKPTYSSWRDGFRRGLSRLSGPEIFRNPPDSTAAYESEIQE
jgi:nucleoside-diphosphate-sugar epimerase